MKYKCNMKYQIKYEISNIKYEILKKNKILKEINIHMKHSNKNIKMIMENENENNIFQ